MIIGIVNKLGTVAAKGVLKLKKHSPEILVACGVVGVGVSTVMACKATLKTNDILEDHKERVARAHEAREIAPEEFSEKDEKQALAESYFIAGKEFVKLYGPSALLMGLSIASIVSSHRILSKRNVVLAAAYETVDKAYKRYRSNVIEKFGEEADREFRYSLKEREVTDTKIDKKTGEEVEQTVVKKVSTSNEYGPYAKFFDESSRYFEKNADYNLALLNTLESKANQMLAESKSGFLFLNDVYKMLDIPITKEGQMMGWKYDIDAPDRRKIIDFGIYNINRESNRRFVNGYEPVILLDFNVQGNVYDMI